MLRPRVIPSLLLHDGALVKTVHFDQFSYIGDPVNTVRIFNELEVDELILLDILASVDGCAPDYALIEQITAECFMPLTYGGGVKSVEDAVRLFDLGIEKVSVNTAAVTETGLIEALANHFGSQSTVASIDVRADRSGGFEVVSHRGRRPVGSTALDWAQEMQRRGAGELLVNVVDLDGTWAGLNTGLIETLSYAVTVPIIMGGGANSLDNIASGIASGAQAVTAGSLFVYQKRDFGVLVNYPSRSQLNAALGASDAGRQTR